MKESEAGEQPSGPGKDNFDRGLHLYDIGEYQKAIEEFNRAGEKGFRTDSVENNLGACYERLELWDNAKEHYAAAVRANSHNLFAMKNLALCQLEEGLWVEARKLLSHVLSSNPEDHDVRLGLARALIQMNRTRKSLSVLKPILRGESADLKLRTLKVLSEGGAFDLIVQQGNGMPPEVVESAEGLKILGEAYLECGMYEEAIECFRKLSFLRDDAISKSLLGLALVASGDDENGITLLEEAKNDEGKDPLVLQNLVFALHGSDQLEDAIPVYEDILKMYPDDCVIWNNLGNALYNLGRYPESIPKFVVALQKNPDYEIAWNNIGNALEKMGLYAESLPYHKRAVEIDMFFDYAHIAEAEALYMLGDYKDAEVAVDIAISLGSVCAEAYMLKARIALMTSPDDALIHALKAVQLELQSAEAHVLLAMCQEAVGRSEDAERSLRIARKLSENVKKPKIGNIEEIERRGFTTVMSKLGLSSDAINEERWFTHASHWGSPDPTFWYRIGLKMLEAGRKENALRAFRSALKIDPDSAAATAMLLRLEREKSNLNSYISNAMRIVEKGLSTPLLDACLKDPECVQLNHVSSKGEKAED